MCIKKYFRGILLITISADHSEIEYNYATLLSLYKVPVFIAFITCFSLFLITLTLLATFYPKKNNVVLFSYSILGGCLGGCQFIIKTFMEIFKMLFIYNY